MLEDVWEAKAPLNYKFFLSTYALRELASDCGLKRSLAEVFGSQMAEQWLCYTIYQMVNGGSEVSSDTRVNPTNDTRNDPFFVIKK